MYFFDAWLITIERNVHDSYVTAVKSILVKDQRQIMAFPHEKIISVIDNFVYLDPDRQQDYPIR